MTELIHRLIESDDNCFVGDYYDPTHRTDEIYTCLDCLEAGIRAAERERILSEVEKLRPYIDANGVNWFAPFNNIIKVIKGEK